MLDDNRFTTMAGVLHDLGLSVGVGTIYVCGIQQMMTKK